MMINKRLIGICGKSKMFIKLTILFNLVALVCNVVVIWCLGLFVNAMVTGEGLDLSVGLIVVGVSLAIRFVCQYAAAKCSYHASASARVRLRQLIYEKLLQLGMDYQDQERTSTVVQMSIEGVEQLEVYFGKYLPQFFYALLAPIVLFVVISQVSWQVALVFMLCVPLIPASIVAIMRIAKKILKTYWNNYANLGDTFLENLQGLTTLKVFSQDAKRHEVMNREAEDFRKITMKVLSMQLNSINVMDLIAFGGSALGTIVALFQFRAGNLQVGHLIIIILLSSEFFIPLRLLGSYFHVAMNGMAAKDRIFDLLDSEEVVISDAQLVPNQDRLEMRATDVDFTYDGARPVLQGVSLSVEPGTITAIVGESGSGKSTMASLLLANKRAAAGSITLNDVELDRIKPEELYRHVSLVSAHSHIFKGTIRENLLMAKPEATEDELWAALEMARLSGFVENLCEKMETLILEDGNSLSGGQKQRLAIARVILANRQMIVFDEATSNIDVESEELIWETIYELAKTKTILVISHRLANIVDAKAIHVFKDGRVVESGTHEELMEKSGDYAKMKLKQEELEQIREVK